METLPNRVLRLNPAIQQSKGPVIYWMSRDQRVADNWALLFARQQAMEQKSALIVLFCLICDFPNANARHFHFMIEGLRDVETYLADLNIPFFLLQGQPESEIPSFINTIKAGTLITDFDPLRIKRQWKTKVMHHLTIPFYEIDAHNIIPCFRVSDKKEFGAYTLRPKINRLLNTYLGEFPKLQSQSTGSFEMPPKYKWDEIYNSLHTDQSVPPINWLKPGEEEANKRLLKFINEQLSDYNKQQNDPLTHTCSNLSPYFHFGHISAQRVALETLQIDAPEDAKAAFLEQLIVRRELSDNYCYFNDHYDSIEGFPAWAQKTLNEHRYDFREVVYTDKQFENAETHDTLWNSAQKEMIITGKMHGYMRMYWAKKILEWSASPEEALRIALYLNDKYELDGRDPNGFTGCAWAIGGVHDRAWGERLIFGKIRYMNESGCKRKFDIRKYIEKMNELSQTK